MDNRSLFTLAHQMAKAVILPGDCYAVTFGACLKAIKGGYKMPDKKSNNVDKDMMTRTYYIGSGRLNAMYTLRVATTFTQQASPFPPTDHYVCNLSTDPQKASDKAAEYVQAIRERIESPSLVILFDPDPVDYLNERRGKLSVKDTQRIEQVERGIFPYGKHAGKPIAEADAGYLLFFADKASKPGNDVVAQALCDACLGIALEKGYIAAREAKREQRKSVERLSKHIGKIGERIAISGEIVAAIERWDEWEQRHYCINKVKMEDNIVAYIGYKLGEVGEHVSFRATVKKHDDYQGIKSTVVNRPHFPKE